MAAGEALRRGWVDEVQRWAAMKRTGVTLRYMTEFGSRCKQKNLLISAQFLHKQLSIRLARRVMELERLPFGLSQKHPVLKVSCASCPLYLLLI
jgi:pyruvate dehydrogenase kinase 2/3/4